MTIDDSALAKPPAVAWPARRSATSSLSVGPGSASDGGSAGSSPALVAEVDRLRAELAATRNQIRHLEIGLASSRRIGAAVGIVMARRAVTIDDAFGMLCLVSQRTGRKLRELADYVIDTGTLPLPPNVSPRNTARPAHPDARSAGSTQASPPT